MISRRLQRLAELVKDCDTLLDVGSDHGLLPLRCFELNKIKRAIVSDLNREPLKQAQKNLNHILASRIDFILSDGLQSINQPFDVLVIAGMGGLTIQSILQKNLSKVFKAQQIILQANSDVVKLRFFMQEQGIELIDESLVFERTHLYVILVYDPKSKLKDRSYSDLFLGPYLMHQYSSMIQAYYVDRLHREARRLSGQQLTSSTNYEILKTHLESLKSP